MTTAKAPLPTELYTAKTMFTLGGGSAAVWIFTTVLAWVFEIDVEKYKWIGLCVALALSFMGAMRLKKATMSLIIVAFFNGLLIYITAVGIDSINQGIKVSKTSEAKAALISFTANKPWWPATTLIDSIKIRKEQYVEVHKKYQESEITNKSLRDSLQVMTTSFQMNYKGNDALKKCADMNQKLLSDLQACKNKDHEKVVVQKIENNKSNESAINALTEIKKMNGTLLKDIESYLAKGQPGTDDLYAIRDMNDKINSFRLQLTDINKKIDQIVKGN